MFVERRRQLILRRLARDGAIRVADLAREWDVNPMTIRRDLSVLEEQKLLRRVYGGALPVGRAESAAPRVGLMVPHTDYYYGPVVVGAERAAHQLGARLVLATHFYDTSLEHERLEKLTSLELDGLVLATTGAAGLPADDEVVEALIDRLKIPVVLVERQLRLRLDGRDPCVVRSAHDRGAILAMDHFRRLGHRRMLAALIRTPTVPGLLAGLEEGAERLGLEVTVRLFPNEPGKIDMAGIARECRDTGIRAVFTHPDLHGAALIEELAEIGLQVPRDVHVISYDDEVAHLGRVPTTAVSPAKEQLGYEAVRLALQWIDSGSEQAVQQVSLTPRLVIRESAPAVAAELRTLAR